MRIEVGLGVDTGFQGIPGEAGLALGGARTGALLRIEASGADLIESGHK